MSEVRGTFPSTLATLIFRSPKLAGQALCLPEQEAAVQNHLASDRPIVYKSTIVLFWRVQISFAWLLLLLMNVQLELQVLQTTLRLSVGRTGLTTVLHIS